MPLAGSVTALVGRRRGRRIREPARKAGGSLMGGEAAREAICGRRRGRAGGRPGRWIREG